MPHISIKAFPGKTAAQKKAFVDGITKTFVDAGIDRKYVTIRLEEIPADQFMEKVYTPCVLNGPGELLKSPGYTDLDEEIALHK